MLPLSLCHAPSHPWWLVVSVRARARACLSVCTPWPEHLGLFFSFSESEIASVNLNSLLVFFVLKVFHQVQAIRRLAVALLRCALHFIPSGFCSISAHACLRSGFVCSCECVHDETHYTIRFCIKPTIDFPATDITSSLQSHTVFHSINFCPPP